MVGFLLRRAGLLAVVAICGLHAAAAGSAAAATVVANGNEPDAVVDRDGVTHLVWNEAASGANPDVLHYCQIPAGGSACVNAESFVPPSNDPSLNRDLYGPHVMVTPFGEVILLTSRCCANQIVGRYLPSVIYVSDDGGESFGAPAAVGNNPGGAGGGQGSPAVFDGADRRILTVSPWADGVHFQAAPLGQWTEAYARLSSGASVVQYTSVVQRERNSFAAAWQDGGNTVWVRTFTCSLDPCPLAQPNDAANWTPPVVVGDAELPRLTSGPAGTFLLYRSSAAATNRQYFVRKLEGATLGPALPVGNSGTVWRDVVEDAAGILHVLLLDDLFGLSYHASGDGGVTWGGRQTIVPLGESGAIQSVRVAARSTDGGFVGSAFWESNNPPEPTRRS